MTTFRTNIPPPGISFFINHEHHLLCIGSCFAEHVGQRLEESKFSTLVNPFGIVYNPVSIAQVLEKLLLGTRFTEADLFENLGLWNTFSHHSKFSHPDPAIALQQINGSLQQARQFLKHTDRLLLTLGTAHVFVYKKTNTIVSNCHKIPGQEFIRRRLSVEEVTTPIETVLQKLKQQLPSLEVVMTVSPVRHLRDGLVENQRSKATLLLGVDAISQTLPFVHYFPSYEIMLDDLRDYRFYGKDLSHPNELAIDYIWEYFEQAFFDSKTKELCRRISQFSTAMSHRPFHPESAAHQSFLRKQLSRIDEMEAKFPHLNFSKEREVFASQLIK